MGHRSRVRIAAWSLAVVVPALGSACSNKDAGTPAPQPAPVTRATPIDAAAARLEPPAPLPELAADPGSGDGTASWTVAIGGLGSDVIRDLASTAAGDVVVAGDFEGEATFGALGTRTSTGVKGKAKSDAFLMKIGADGTPAWVQTLGGEHEDTGTAVAVGPDLIAIGGLFGKTMSVGGMSVKGAGSDDAYVAAFAHDGTPRWLWNAGGDASDAVLAVAATADGGFLAAGGFFGKAAFGPIIELEAISYEDAFLVKLSADGEVEWARHHGGDRNDRFAHLAVDGQGSIYALGTFQGKAAFGGPTLESAGSHDLVLVKFDPRGEHQWSRRFGGIDNEVAGGLAVDPSGNVTLVGSFDKSITIGDDTYRAAGTSDVLVVRLDTHGELSWTRRFGGRGEDIASGAAADAAGNVIVSGWFEGVVDFGAGPLKAAGSNKDIFVVKLDATGATRWTQRFGDKDHDKARAAAVTPDGDVYIGGIFRFVLTAPTRIESVYAPGDRAPKSDGFVMRIQR